MELPAILEFLRDLNANNKREWFHANAARHKDAKASFEVFTDMLITEIQELDPSIAGVTGKGSMFRIHRDVRFSNDKRPYKTNFGSFMAPGGRKSGNAGYYIHMEPGKSFIGGGLYMPSPTSLKAIRKRIYENPDSLLRILNNPNFKTYFDGFYGNKLKTAPRGYPKDWEHVDLLNHKHYAVHHALPDDFWDSAQILEDCVRVFKAQHPLNLWLNETINK